MASRNNRARKDQLAAGIERRMFVSRSKFHSGKIAWESWRHPERHTREHPVRNVDRDRCIVCRGKNVRHRCYFRLVRDTRGWTLIAFSQRSVTFDLNYSDRAKVRDNPMTFPAIVQNQKGFHFE